MARGRRGKKAAEVDFRDRSEVEGWLRGQPREVSMTVAVRAALRVLPLIERARTREEFVTAIVLPVFRAAWVSWTIAEYPGQRDRLARAAYAAAAADAADAAADAAAYAAAYAAADAAHAADAAAAYAAADAAAHAAAYAAADAAAHAAAYAAADAAAADAAAADAADAAYAADAAADAVVALSRQEAILIEEGRAAPSLVNAPLWSGPAPAEIGEAWRRLRQELLAAGADWDVWTQWYDNRLAGAASLGETFDAAVASLPDELWKQGPTAVNARIKELIAEHTPAEPIPVQGAGPHFSLDDESKIAVAPPNVLDPAGNNLGRIRQLLPAARQAADNLLEALATTNAFPELKRSAGRYRAAIDGEAEAIAWGAVFGFGVILETAAAAADRPEPADQMRPRIEDGPKSALDAVLAIHGPLILATAEGRELTEESDRFSLAPDVQSSLRNDATQVARRLAANAQLIDPPAGALVLDAAEVIGQGTRPNRGAVFGLTTFGHAATLLIPAAAVASFALWAGALAGAAAATAAGLVLRESGRVKEAAKVLGGGFDRLVDTVRDQGGLARAQAIARLRVLAPFRDFVLANEEPLSRIAANSPRLRWMRWYIGFIVGANNQP